MVNECRGYGSLSVASGSFGYVWDWECRGGKPVIVGSLVRVNLQTNATSPVVFDAQGYSVDEWEALR
jgi:hypothetical protein